MPGERPLEPAEIAQALDLNGAERDYVERYRITSFDELHADLVASPSLEHTRPAIRRALILARLEPLLSNAYRQARAEPEPDVTFGALLNRDRGRVDLQGWPGATMPADLNAEAQGVDLLGDWPNLWPVRDQGYAEPTCVPFTANACLERAALKPGLGAERLASVFLYQRIRSRFGPAQGKGGSKLTEIAATMPASGVCREALWRDSETPMAQPSDAALQDALTRRRGAECTDLGWQAANRPSGAARVVLQLLRQGLPVAITMPTFRDPASGSTITNWTDAYARVTGEVRPKKDEWDFVGGHAVCILGFQPAIKDPLGGYFVFRNSWGSRFATQPLSPPAAKAGEKPVSPTVPGIGYGVIGASQIEGYVAEILVFP